MKLQNMIIVATALTVLHICALQVSARAAKHAAMPLLLVGYKVSPSDGATHAVLKIMQKDLSFTGQFKVDAITERSLNYAAWQKKYPIAVVVKRADKHRFIWHLYDSTSKRIIAEGNISAQDSDRAYAHALSDAVWKELTGCEGFFSTRIVYCKEKLSNNKIDKHIFVADYDGTHEQLLVDAPDITVAPRWNQGCSRPLIFYSAFGDANVRMMYTDLHKNKHIACDFDGVSMLPAFSKDGSSVVFCASNGKGTTQLYKIVNGKAKRLTGNSGNNFCPTLTEDGSKVYFCSDCGLGQPSLFVYDMQTKALERIPETAGSETPCYSPIRKRIAYAKNVKGIMQLCLYDINQKKHMPLTEDAGSKQSVSWSPCGNYVLYAHEMQGKSSLCMMQVSTKRVIPLREITGNISYPNWSPRYERYPDIA